ncbi:MAG: TMEM175 family protein [Chloroflexota bacterium]
MMTTPSHEKDIGYERLVMFTDGIFAIAITLLGLEIRIPDLENRADLGQAIINLLPQIFVFALCFAMVGIFWLAHYSMFRHIERSDSRFMGLSLVYLMLIAFLPVPAGTLGRYGSEFPAVVFFALTMLLVGIVELIIWKYASFNGRLMRPGVSEQQIKATTWRTLYVIIIFGVSILIAFVSPLWAMLSWILLLFTRPLINRYFERTTPS